MSLGDSDEEQALCDAPDRALVSEEVLADASERGRALLGSRYDDEAEVRTGGPIELGPETVAMLTSIVAEITQVFGMSPSMIQWRDSRSWRSERPERLSSR